MVAKPVTVGVVGVIVLASALVLNYFVLPGEESEPATKVAAPAAPPPAPARQPEKTEKQASAAPAEKSPGATASTAPPPEEKAPPKPSFDVVRVDPDGNTVIAGRGTPNTEIAIVDGDKEIGRVTSDDRGEWVFVPPSKLSPGQRVLTLKELGDGKAESSEAVVLVIPEKGKDIAGRASSEPSVPLAVVVPKDGGGDQRTAARVLQAPAAGPLQAAPAGTDKPAAETDAAASRVAAAEPGAPVPPGTGSQTASPSASPSASAGTAPAGTAPASPATGTGQAAGQATGQVSGQEAAGGGVAAAQQPTGRAAGSETTAVASAGSQSGEGVRREVAPVPAAAPAATPSAGPATAGSSTPDTQTAPVAGPTPSGAPAPAPVAAPAGQSQLASAAPVVSAYPEARPPAPAEAAEDPKKEVAVDVIDYDDKGDVVFSGRAEPGSRVEVFIDNRKVGHTGTDTEGRWTMRPAEPVAPGSYQLRVDKVAPSGTVQARVAFPFVRADPLTNLPNNRLVVIQPGNNLWRIATRVYGSGFRYVEIFDANKDQILDPDLIYPGQVFGLPRVN